ncbi:D-tagatose-bisphosphate aldolase, class II, non-catalytic subunit [Nguyenibacter sp. L1]|uniref:D-tagatose-bisphosphate aldolase, class II, non-catalytic subunit n=1 Tax=Nguyenibacter sp. L1 TaxID=3049350 RepID=UPI002B482413|nr:D-tagatose-bisphosphate aldolase, class II, non-catalytic subunit [Nguyenibacter sp. L1]WRH87055.1 D-tagatose-bisphosphate aldolase, class II, non-catalytic subunit [Nguyenibacter sp. L1]
MTPETAATGDGPLAALRPLRDQGHPRGIVSVCSAHPMVIEAALRHARARGTHALIEATCNQVNQDGGYTGMTPADFRDFVFAIAGRIGLPPARIILGGDHLGPNPWRHLPPDDAMARAGDMIAAYVRAGFRKLHLDASMGCRGEPPHLPDAIVAQRAARLAARAETQGQVTPGRITPGQTGPLYVIGTEIPTPGGATEALDHLAPTAPDAALATWRIHQAAFAEHAPAAWSRVLGLVVQPGVEFGHDDVAIYRPDRARALSATLDHMPGLVFEAHSTDYQPDAALASLVRDGFAILKVGPELTFALREALYGLDAMSGFLHPGAPSLRDTMERLMLAAPAHWAGHYPGAPDAQHLLRHFSYSDRIRYYWPTAEAGAAVQALRARLSSAPLPPTLVSQYLPRLYDRVRSGALPATPDALLLQAVGDVLDRYGRAAGDPPAKEERQ